MNTTKIILTLLISLPLLAQEKLSETDAAAIANDAYIYGYPLVTMEMTRRVMTNTETGEEAKAPMGQFANAHRFPDASFKTVTAPNADTLYSVAWINLSKEPYVLHLPDEKGRYYLMPLLSGWTNVFESPGSRTTGTGAQDYAITGPGWSGTIPAGVKEIKSPTHLVWILGRTYSTGTPDDYKAVYALQDQYKLTPLSAYGKPYTPPKGSVDPAIDMKTPVRDQVNKMDIATYFTTLATLMQENPPAAEDAPMLAKMAKIGLEPGKAFDMSALDPKIAKRLQFTPRLAVMKIMSQQSTAGQDVNGWSYSLKTGNYGTDYLNRALIAAIGLGANLPADAVYPFTKGDGANKYVLHFDHDQLPPVKGFWSLTMYDDQYFFVANGLSRFSISPRDPLIFNADGSLDLLIQAENPGGNKQVNWLPAPKGPFILMLRLYWPDEPVLNGTWKPPAIKRMR